MTSKRTQVVMLPTKEKANSLWSYKNRKLYSNEQNNPNDIDETIYYNLYFLSDEEIKEGDYWYIWLDNNQICQADGMIITINNHIKNNHIKKIIATTDKSLKIQIDGNRGNLLSDVSFDIELPQPSQDFIKVFVGEYNKGNIIEWVDVEYEEKGYWINLESHSFAKKPEWIYTHDIIKVNSKNEIIIRKIKDSWNRNELQKLFNSYGDNLPAKVIWNDIQNL